MKGVNPGSKFYKYDGDNPVVVRIANIDESRNIIRYFDENGVKWKADITKFMERYTMLAPDAIISFAIVNINEDRDVIVAAKRIYKYTEETTDNENLPNIICRQMMTDVFCPIEPAVNPNRKIIGSSVSQTTCPANFSFEALLSCTGIESNLMISVYLDDTLDTILKFVPVKKYNEVFKDLNSKYEGYYEGLCKSINELLVDNKFMYDFRCLFNIKEVPFHIDEESESLSAENVAYLSSELNINILETYVLKYAKDIDLNSITRNYILVTSAQDMYNGVYIVGYDYDKK